MRVTCVALFLLSCTLTLSAPRITFASTVFFAQTDASVQSNLPPNNQGIAQVFTSAASGNAQTIAIRTTSGSNGNVDCSQTSNGNMMRLALWPVIATSSQPLHPAINYAWFIAATTTPDADGNCFYNYYPNPNFYNTSDTPQSKPSSKGIVIDAQLVAGNTYMVAIDDATLRWDHDSFGGSASGAGAGVKSPTVAFTSGGVGVASYFMTISDTDYYVSPVNVGTGGVATSSAIVATTSVVSNVLFLPGAEGSRLYEGTGCGKSAEEKLWEPVGESLVRILRGAGDAKVKELFLNSDGTSACADIYAKEGDILDSAGGSNIYKSFISEMNGLKSDGTIVDWKPVAYDWRLSLNDLLKNGVERDGKIYYEEASSTPYIEQTLRSLAASSKTGKVTIVAHSNGGLIAKALLNQLGGEAAKLVGKVILVGAPQSGAPIAIGGLLFGLDQGISSKGINILHSDVARTLVDSSPAAYHFLPSEDYLKSIATDSNHPVARFAGDGYSKEIAAYGTMIKNSSDLADFLLAKEGGRVAPAANDVTKAAVLNSTLINYANAEHATLDPWTPPAGIEVDQIAGWGVDTIAGIDFYTQKRSIHMLTPRPPLREYRPIITEDGDGTVPVPSALMMGLNTNVKRYWVDLDSYRIASSIRRDHKDIFEVPSLQDFIKNIIENSTSTLPAFISLSQPSSLKDNKRLIFFLHSPLTLQLQDASGNITGLASDDSITQDIPDSSYGEFGDAKYITVPEGGQYQLTLHGQADGEFSLDIQEFSDGVITASSTIANVPTTASTLASLTISGGIDTVSALTVDESGDGKNIISISPEVGQTVTYEPDISVPAISPTVSSGGAGAISIPIITPVAVATTTAPVIATSTSKPIQTKKKLSVAIILPKKPNINLPQTAFAYSASQQPIFSRLGAAVYNGFHGFWTALKKLF